LTCEKTNRTKPHETGHKTGVTMALSDKQLKTIPCILAAKTIEAGCKKAKISKSQYYEWLKDDVFKAELDRQRNELIERAFNFLLSSLSEAAQTLKNLLTSENQHIQRLAAVNILEQTHKLSDRQDILERLEKIEKVLENRKNR